MTLDLHLLGGKLRRYREQLLLTHADVTAATGIAEGDLRAFEGGERSPSGDQILILADFYKCDYRFFLSNDRLAPLDQTEMLFRRHGDELTARDRWAIQEFLFLCESEQSILVDLGRRPDHPFQFTKHGTFFKQHGVEAAQALRKHLGLTAAAIPSDIFETFRSLGFHVFRRKLDNSEISGLCIRHPTAGPCLLVNYGEDVYRQRFTAAHEAAHAILDADQEFVVSFQGKSELPEVRANIFASAFLLPPEALKTIPDVATWTQEKAQLWAAKLKVSTKALSIALSKAGLVADATERVISSVSVPADAKVDPELPASLAPGPKSRKQELLQRGLSDYYVRLCFEAHQQGKVSIGRLAEALLLDSRDLLALAGLFNQRLAYAE